MISDIWAIMRKEFKEFLVMRGRRGGLIGLAITIGMFGILLPMQDGPGWFAQPSVLFYAYIPCITAMSIVADSFAGERERHTLETLLASRLPDTAILFGKIAFIVSYSWGSSVAAILTALVMLNVKYGHTAVAKSSTMIVGGMHATTPWVVGTLTFVGLILAVFMTAVGILLSMRASTVKQVQQTMGLVIMGFFLVPAFGIRLIPHELLERAFQSASAMGARNSAILVAAMFVLLDVSLLAVAITRFRRARLILD